MSHELSTFTPKQIVSELDRFIVGQTEAKRAVAIALRNRWRRMQLPERLQNEVFPKNILMVGPTGIGKTEIARRLAKLVRAPFIKVEATKFTEIGYVGRDVEQIIRDLTDIAIRLETQLAKEGVQEKAKEQAESRILDALTGIGATAETRLRFKQKIQKGELDESVIDIKVNDAPPSVPSFDVPGMPGSQVGMLNLGDIFSQALGKDKKVIKKMTVKNAMSVLMQEESEELIDNSQIISNAIRSVEQNGIVFIDEIDKICNAHENYRSVSQEGVQRDLLPLIEGTSVSTKYGQVQTDHVLFITSGAFQIASPSDLLPELQGRLPIRVNLNPLTKDDFVRILTEPENNLINQARALLDTEEVSLVFADEAINEIASIAVDMNEKVENIGARRLYTVIEKLLEDINFNADTRKGEKIEITSEVVREQLGKIQSGQDFKQFIL